MEKIIRKYVKEANSLELPFPISMENLPRHRGFCCFSLKFGTIFTALVVILYSILGLAQCGALLGYLPTYPGSPDSEKRLVFSILIAESINYAVTFILTAVMLVGALRERCQLIRPWLVWSSIQIMALLMMFVFWSTTSVINSYNESGLLIYVIEFMILMIRVYMLVLVTSYYRQLEEDADHTERLKKLIDRDTWYTVA